MHLYCAVDREGNIWTPRDCYNRYFKSLLSAHQAIMNHNRMKTLHEPKLYVKKFYLVPENAIPNLDKISELVQSARKSENLRYDKDVVDALCYVSDILGSIVESEDTVRSENG